MEGWIYGVSMQIGQATEEADILQGVIASVPTHLRQASSFLYAELLAATSGVQMATILEVTALKLDNDLYVKCSEIR